MESSNPWLQHESPISSSSDVLCYIIKLILHALSKSKRSKGDTFEIWPQILVLLSFDTLPFAYARLPRIMTFLCNISLPANFCLQVVHTQTYQFILNFSFTYLNILRLIRESLLRSETRCHSLHLEPEKGEKVVEEKNLNTKESIIPSNSRLSPQ